MLQIQNDTNTTDSHHTAILTTNDRIILSCYYGIAVLLGIIGNVMVLFGILHSRRNRKKIQNYYLITLSMSNLFLSIVSGPYYLTSLVIVDLKQPSESLHRICRFVLFLNYSVGYVGLLIVTTISTDRYFAVRHPFFYNKYFDKRIVICINLYVWLQSFITFLPPVIKQGWSRYDGKPGLPCGFQWRKISSIYIVVFGTFSFGIPAIIVFFTNVSVCFIARKQFHRTFTLGKIIHAKEESYSRASKMVVMRSPKPFNCAQHDESECSKCNISTTVNKTRADALNDTDLEHDCTFLNEKQASPTFHGEELVCRKDDKVEEKKENALEQTSPCMSQSGAGEQCFEMQDIAELNSTTGKDKELDKANTLREFDRMKYEKYAVTLKMSGMKSSEPVITASTGHWNTPTTTEHATGIAKKEGTPYFENIANVGKNTSECKKNQRKIPSDSENSVLFIQDQESRNGTRANSRSYRIRQEWKIRISTVILVITFFAAWSPYLISRAFIAAAGTIISWRAVIYTTISSNLSAIITPYIILGTRQEICKYVVAKLLSNKFCH